MSDRFDGLPVDTYQARFSGTFECDLKTPMEGEAMLIVIVRTTSASIKPTASGDIKRVDSLQVRQAAFVRNPSLRDELADRFGFERPMDIPLPIFEVEEADVVYEPAFETTATQASSPLVPPPGPNTGPGPVGSVARDPYLASFVGEA